MTLEWISIGNGEWETPDGWWVQYDEICCAWQYGFQDMPMGWQAFAADAKAECERMERNSR